MTEIPAIGEETETAHAESTGSEGFDDHVPGAAAAITVDGWSMAYLTNHFDIASGGREPSPMDLEAKLLIHVDAGT